MKDARKYFEKAAKYDDDPIPTRDRALIRESDLASAAIQQAIDRGDADARLRSPPGWPVAALERTAAPRRKRVLVRSGTAERRARRRLIPRWPRGAGESVLLGSASDGRMRFRTGDPPMNPADLAAWQAPFWAWCSAGAAAFALLCLLWSASSYWSAWRQRAEPSTQWVLLRIAAGAALGAVIGGAGHQVQAQALDCLQRGIEWNRCRVGLLENRTRPLASVSAAPTSTLAMPPPAPRRR